MTGSETNCKEFTAQVDKRKFDKETKSIAISIKSTRKQSTHLYIHDYRKATYLQVLSSKATC